MGNLSENRKNYGKCSKIASMNNFGLEKQKLDESIQWGAYFLALSAILFVGFWEANTFFVSIIIIICLFSILMLNIPNIKRLIYRLKYKFHPPTVFQTILVIIFVFQIRMIFSYPDWSWDGLWYHSPAALAWSRNLHLAQIHADSYANSYPSQLELTQATLWHFFPGAPAQLVNFIFFWALLLILRRLLLIYLFPQHAIDGLFIAVVTLPVVFSQLLTAYTDVQFGMLITISSLFAGLYWKDPNNKKLFIGSLIYAAIACMIKYSGFAWVAIIDIFGIIVFVLNYRKQTVRNVKLQIKTLLLVALITAVSFLWEIRNALTFNNPLFPFNFGIGPVTLIKGLAGTPNEAFLNRESSQSNHSNHLFSFFETLKLSHPNFIYDARTGGFGILWIAIFVLGILAFTKSTQNLRIAALLITAFTLFSPANWWPRYITSLAFILLILIFSRIYSSGKIAKLIASALVTISMIQAILYLPFIGSYDTYRPQPKNLTELFEPWRFSASTKQILGVDLKQERQIAPELASVSNSKNISVAFWWTEPLILPLLGKNGSNKLIKIEGMQSNIPKVLTRFEPRYFVTRQTIEPKYIPKQCHFENQKNTGIYAAKTYLCTWNNK